MNSLKETPDILITGGTLLTMAPPEEIVEDPVIGIRDGKIGFIEKGKIPAGHCGNARENDERPCRASLFREHAANSFENGHHDDAHPEYLCSQPQENTGSGFN